MALTVHAASQVKNIFLLCEQNIMFAHLKIKAYRASANREWWAYALWQLGSNCVTIGVQVRSDSALANQSPIPEPSPFG